MLAPEGERAGVDKFVFVLSTDEKGGKPLYGVCLYWDEPCYVIFPEVDSDDSNSDRSCNRRNGNSCRSHASGSSTPRAVAASAPVCHLSLLIVTCQHACSCVGSGVSNAPYIPRQEPYIPRKRALCIPQRALYTP